MAQGCTAAVDRLKAGPAAIPEIIAAGTKWTDPDFGPNTDSLFWEDYTASATDIVDSLKEIIADDAGVWLRWQEKYPTHDIFDPTKEPEIKEAW